MFKFNISIFMESPKLRVEMGQDRQLRGRHYQSGLSHVTPTINMGQVMLYTLT